MLLPFFCQHRDLYLNLIGQIKLKSYGIIDDLINKKLHLSKIAKIVNTELIYKFTTH